MADKYLNNTGLQYFYNRLKTIFANQTDLTNLSNRVDEIVAEGGEPNKIDSISVNGTEQTITNKNVNIAVPTKTSDLTNDGDGTSNFATEDYVSQNGGKIDSISVNSTAQTIDEDKNVNIVVPDITFGGDGKTMNIAPNPAGSDDIATIWFDDTHKEVAFSFTTSAGGDLSARVPMSEAVPTKTSDLTNDSNFQTEAQVQALIDSELADITGIDFQVVTELPSTGTKGTIYLKHKDGAADDIYDEYIWVEPAGQTAHYEKIGTTDIDLSGYWAISDLVAITTAEIDTIMA